MAYSRSGYENGAATYSREIVELHLPVWEKCLSEFDGEAMIGTCRPMIRRNEKGALAVQYLHTYHYDRPLEQPMEIYRSLRGRFGQVVLVTAYKQLHKQLLLQDVPSIHLPMAIDSQKLAQTNRPTSRLDRIIYFGNITPGKEEVFAAFKKAVRSRGLKMDVISKGEYKGRPVSQQESWNIIAQYQYGAGVGRCALEMMSLGLGVFICGLNFGGIITDENDYRAQSDANFGGRIVTYDRDMRGCLDSRDLMLRGVTSDLRGESFKELERTISHYVSGIVA